MTSIKCMQPYLLPCIVQTSEKFCVSTCHTLQDGLSGCFPMLTTTDQYFAHKFCTGTFISKKLTAQWCYNRKKQRTNMILSHPRINYGSFIRVFLDKLIYVDEMCQVSSLQFGVYSIFMKCSHLLLRCLPFYTLIGYVQTIWI